MVLVFSACTEDDLTLNPQGKELDVTYYQTESQLQEAIYAAYDPLQHIVWGANPFMWGSITSDDAVGGGGDLTDQKSYQLADRFEITAVEDKDADLLQLWESRFKVIYRSNQILKFADATTDFGKMARAHANFLKGYAYFELTRMFGGLPLIDKVASPDDKFGRATQEETWAAIEGYLKSAIVDLPDRTASSNGDPQGLATKASAQALLGKVYVYEKKYSEAIEILMEVANNSNYGIEDNYADVFSPGNSHGKESIFEINFANFGGGEVWDQYVSGNASYTLCGPRTGEVPIANVDFFWGWGMNQPTQKLAEAFDAMGDIERKNASIISSDSIKITSPTTNFQNELTGFWDMKHVRRIGYFTGTTRVAQNIIVLRLADVYLLLAEAYANSGNESSALNYLNLIRRRAGLTDASGGSDLMTKIKKERQLELCLEGDRYFDLVRWGDAATELTGEEYDQPDGLNYSNGRPGTSTNGLFPIPQAEMNKIGATSDFQQNPGY